MLVRLENPLPAIKVAHKTLIYQAHLTMLVRLVSVSSFKYNAWSSSVEQHRHARDCAM